MQLYNVLIHIALIVTALLRTLELSQFYNDQFYAVVGVADLLVTAGLIAGIGLLDCMILSQFAVLSRTLTKQVQNALWWGILILWTLANIPFIAKLVHVSCFYNDPEPPIIYWSTIVMVLAGGIIGILFDCICNVWLARVLYRFASETVTRLDKSVLLDNESIESPPSHSIPRPLPSHKPRQNKDLTPERTFSTNSANSKMSVQVTNKARWLSIVCLLVHFLDYLSCGILIYALFFNPKGRI